MSPPHRAAAGTPSISRQGKDRSSERREFDEVVLNSRILLALVLAAGFAARLFEAWAYFLNPDEALHSLQAHQTSLALTYRAALTDTHPPLLILVLHYWRWLGHSELILRMPSVLAGTACCWFAYRWLKEVTDDSTAFVGLLLFAFAPSLIGLSAEVRQYALLLFFISGCLYLAEPAIRQNSSSLMVLFSLSLYGALLTHYSSLIFACCMGVYMLLRLYPYKQHLKLVAVWGAGQVLGVALSTYFLVTHALPLRRSGVAEEIADTWLRRSIFHPGQNHVVPFVATQTLRVFTFLLSHGLVGTLALLAFLVGMVSLLRTREAFPEKRPTGRELALLLGLPFAVNCIAALAGLYPYGGTRHNAFLAIFALSGACIGLGAWNPARAWAKPVVVAGCLFLCNFFPSPPPMIRASDHRRILMSEAVDSLRTSAAPGSILFADYQSGLLLGYYVCGRGVVQVFPSSQPFFSSTCGPYTAITPRQDEWKFYANDLPEQLAGLVQTYGLAPGTKVWLFDAGWIADSAPALRRQLQQLGCSAPQSFGENILLCQIVVSGSAGQPNGSGQ